MTVASSEAVKPVIGMLRLLVGEVAVKVFTTGALESTTTTGGEANTAETWPTTSFAQGYNA